MRWIVLAVLAGCNPNPSESDQDTDDSEAVETDLVETDSPTDTEVDPLDTDEPADTDVLAPVVLWRVRAGVGETFYLDGDNLLAPLGVGNQGSVSLISSPPGAVAVLEGGSRLTPDVAGTWTLATPAGLYELNLEDDFLDADTFLNYSYSPQAPLLVDGPDRFWVASPPSDAVVEVLVSGDGFVTGRLVPTGGWPTALAAWGDLILVAQTGRDSVGFLDPVAGRLLDSVRVGDEPGAIVVDGDTAWVVLSGSDEVVRLDLLNRVVDRRVSVGNEPKAAAFDPVRRQLIVASQLSSNGHPLGPEQGVQIPEADQHDLHVIDVDSASLVGTVDAVGTIIRDLYVSGDDLWVAYSDSHNADAQVSADSHPHSHHLGRVDLDTLMVVDRLELGEHPGSSGAAASPMHMLEHDGALWVGLSASKSVVALDPSTFTELRRVEVGNDPRGLAVVGGKLLTYAWLDNAIVWLDDDGVAGSLEVGRDPTPDDVKQGQRIFYDATFSRYGEFSCNSCHIDGVNDGLTWDILLDGVVNTLPFRNIGGTGPFLWGGFLPTLFDFSREVLRLVGADDATGEQMELLNRYMQSVTAPPNPHTLPGGEFTAQAQRGRAVFEGVGGCMACHPPPLYTSRQVVDGKTDGLPTDVPSLIGVWDNGPWGRHGQWTTLPDMADAALAYTGAGITTGARDDLVAFLEQIPGDALYLTSASPLAGSQHVWTYAPVELAFSGLLAPGQASALTIERAEDGGPWTSVPGSWSTAGRFARFVPDAGQLTPERDWRITVAGGLRGALGTELSDPLEVLFATGADPATDISGTWNLALDGFAVGALDMGFLQARGGQVTGARVDSGGLIDFDNVRGYVEGERLVLGEFVALLQGFEVLVDSMIVDLVDTDADGYADEGTGLVRTPFVDLDVVMVRLSLP